MTNEQVIGAIEREVMAAVARWLAGTMSGDADALDAVLAPDYTYTHASSGAVDDRETWLESFRSGRRRYDVYTVHDTSIRAYPGVAVLSGKAHQEMRPRGEPIELNTAFLSAWVPLDGEWKCVAWQATRLAKPAG